MRRILDLNSKEVKDFLLKSESYAYFNLPSYFIFSNLLRKVSTKIGSSNLSDFYKPGTKPADAESVNYVLIGNKNGKYDWRPFQLVHPALYVELVNTISKAKNWKEIQARFKYFNKNNFVECTSLPVISSSKESDKAAQVFEWWLQVEQKSIELALEFDYLFHTDIVDCYGSIYTHTVAWAIHSKDVAKTKKRDLSLAGNKIDSILRDMSHGQTNGIPQGSVLMDFIAEIVLGYADELLTKKIKAEKSIHPKDFKIIRYRDDYRIFSDSTITIDRLVKLLTETLIELGLKLNSNKTTFSQNVVTDSVKEDKLFWIQNKREADSVYEAIQLVHQLSEKHPNSGTLDKELHNLSKEVEKKSSIKGNVQTMISYVVDIAFKNPRTYSASAALLSKLLSLIKDEDEKLSIIKKILRKFQKIPNTGILELWLQRILINKGHSFTFDEPLCKVVSGKLCLVWNSNWLKDDLSDLINSTSLIDQKVLKGLKEVIEAKEVRLFAY